MNDQQKIQNLRREAHAAGDEAMVAICDRAVAGDDDATQECLDVIREAAREHHADAIIAKLAEAEYRECVRQGMDPEQVEVPEGHWPAIRDAMTDALGASPNNDHVRAYERAWEVVSRG